MCQIPAGFMDIIYTKLHLILELLPTLFMHEFCKFLLYFIFDQELHSLTSSVISKHQTVSTSLSVG